MTDASIAILKDATVIHPRHGQGTVLMEQLDTVIVRFGHGIEQVFARELKLIESVSQSISTSQFSPSLPVALRTQAASISSVNSAWGVFTRSRIALLPHQLWVCHRALKTWPIRLLIADDVGMGKTIEAGLLLWPLLASRKVQRALILCPAKLVEQWQTRLKKMFDIRAATYRSDLDNPRTDFWGIHPFVIASLPTLRADRKGRHDRLLDAPTWDMVVVDEAHHLNVDEVTGKTLGFELLEQLNRAGKMTSCVFFTGTPHRGKDFGFWSLMSLLDATVFQARGSEAQMLGRLPKYLIRNAKQKATDMKGDRLFRPIVQYPETFSYTVEEQNFYDLMSEFILAGKAYATSLSETEGGQVILVLIALQKLASSSIAAVVAALKTRIRRLAEQAARKRSEILSFGDDDDDESQRTLVRWLREAERERLRLMENEGQYLTDLVRAASRVNSETRVARVIEIIKNRFPNEPVLLFTEYKRTQCLVVNALIAEFGEGCVGFMNGDDRLDDVRLADGRLVSLPSRREETCDAFNAGRMRFLVSTEAGGEGIDLQAHCSALIHVDLPWNPMRLHQRVGRLNRYGQRESVRVVSLRNPATVEAMIWGKLEDKIASIMRALGSAMDEPEDLMQLVLGMSGQRIFDDLFSGAVNIPQEKLSAWFDRAAGTLGGEDVVKKVRDLVGHATSFDLSDLKTVPPVDLPDLLPFFQGILTLNRRRPKLEGAALSFRTPDEWQDSHAIRQSYEGLTFDRRLPSGHDLIGVGHPLFERALHQAGRLGGAMCLLNELAKPILVFELSDRVTDSAAASLPAIAAITEAAGSLELMRDWEVLRALNSAEVRGDVPDSRPDPDELNQWRFSALSAAPELFAPLGSQFSAMAWRETALFWPAVKG